MVPNCCMHVCKDAHVLLGCEGAVHAQACEQAPEGGEVSRDAIHPGTEVQGAPALFHRVLLKTLVAVKTAHPIRQNNKE
jgi:hypothetical protein